MAHLTNLPPNWAASTLERVCVIERGITFPSSVKESEKTKVNIACLRTSNVQATVNWTDLIYVPRAYVSNEAKLVREGDILISLANSAPLVGKVSFVDKLLMESTFGGFISVIRADNLIDPFFLYLYLNSDSVQSILQNWASQTTNIANLAVRELKKLPVPLPSLPEQRRIVAILRRADNLCQLRRQVNQQAQDLLPALFYELFGNLTPSRHYEFVHLAEVADVVSGVAKGRSMPPGQRVTVPYIRVANVQAGFLDLSEIKSIEALPSEIDLYRLEKDDILLTEGGDFDKLGRGALWDQDIPDCIHQNHIFRVRLNHDRVRPGFFEQYLQTSFAKAYFLRAAKRTTNIASINLTQLKALPVPVINVDDQDEFVKRADALRAARRFQDNSATGFEYLFQSLITRAFTGEITATWRDAHTEELIVAATDRDRLLGDAAQRPGIGQTYLSTEAMWAETVELLLKQVVPSSQQLLKHLGTTLSLVQGLEQRPFLEMSKQLERMAEVNASIVNAALFQSVQSLPEGTQRSLALSAERIRQAINEWSNAVSQQYRRAIQLMTLSWAERLAEIAVTVVRGIDRDHPRYQMLCDLSDGQHSTYLALQSVARYATVEVLAKETGRSPQQVAQDLALLTRAGLIQTMAVSTRPMGDQVVYVQVYRALQSSDDLRSNDLEQLKKQLEELSA